MIFNNHGWSLKEMILCCCVLLIALFFVVFYVNRLMDSLTGNVKVSTKNSITYSTIEKNIEDMSLVYINDYYKKDIGTGTITVLVTNLLKRGILYEPDLVTSNGDSCTGYALVRKNDEGKLAADAYINCDKYVTKNYQYWRIGD